MDGKNLATKIWLDWSFLFSPLRRLDEVPVEDILEAGLVGVIMYPRTRMGGEVLAEEIIHHLVAGELGRVDVLCQSIIFTVGHDGLAKYFIGVSSQGHLDA